jgi:Putative DNA-binding domain
MSLRRVNLTDLNQPRLLQILQDGLVEGPEVEFKLELTERPAQFLKEITAFANTNGGDVLVGVADNGKPTGVPSDTLRALIDRVNSALDGGVDPPLKGVQYHPVQLADSLSVLVIRVPFSLSGPHMITSDGKLHFYRRSEAASVPMRADDLRNAFMFGANLARAIDRWRDERLASVVRGGNVPLPRVYLHVFPFSAFGHKLQVDIATLTNGLDGLAVLQDPPTTTRILLEGIARGFSSDWNQSSTLLSRTGWIESHARIEVAATHGQTAGIFRSSWFRVIMGTAHKHLLRLRDLNVSPPIAIGITLHDIRGTTLVHGSAELGRADYCSDAIIPFTVIERWPVDLADVLWPCFDHLVGAFGLSSVPESARFHTLYSVNDS